MSDKEHDSGSLEKIINTFRKVHGKKIELEIQRVLKKIDANLFLEALRDAYAGMETKDIPAPKTHFEDFRIIDTLHGGMGQVYISRYDSEHAEQSGKAEFDISTLKDLFGNEPVAVKVMREVKDIMGRTRFEREISASKRLADTDLVANIDQKKAPVRGRVMPILYDAVTIDDRGVEIPYFVMPRLFALPKKRFSYKEAVTLAYNISKIMAEVHEEGMIHRDLKPGNILLIDEEDYEKPVISDFGLVKHVLGGLESRQTASDIIIGTPAYMSPEQASGKIHDLLEDIKKCREEKEGLLVPEEKREKTNRLIDKEKDRNRRKKLRKAYASMLEKIEESQIDSQTEIAGRLKQLNKEIHEKHREACKSDQYSLAAILYEWVTGKHPSYHLPGQTVELEGDEIKVVKDSEEQAMKMLYAVQNPNTQLKFLPNELGIDDNLSAVILKAMEKNPEKRYKTTDDFVREIGLCIEGEKPWVLIENPDYLDERMLRKAGVGYFIEREEYRKGRQRLESLVNESKMSYEACPTEEAGKIADKWVDAFNFYRERLRKKLSETKEYMGSCSAEEFEENVGAFLELVYEAKLVPLEEKFGDEFPSLSDEEGKWKLDEGVANTCGYWVDILRIGELSQSVRRRNEILKEVLKDEESQHRHLSPEAVQKRYFAFRELHGESSDPELQELFLKGLNLLEKQYKKFNEIFIPMWDKEELDSKNRRLGGTALGIESLVMVDALFNANRYVPDNRYAKMALKQVDTVIDNLMREDGSVFRFGIFDENGNLIKNIVCGLKHAAGLAKEGDINYDKFEDGKNTSRYTWADGQAYFIRGLVEAYKHTKNERYIKTAEKAINFFIDSLPDDLISYFAVNDPKGENAIKSSCPTASAAYSLIDYADLTGDKKAKETAVRLLQALVREKMDVSKEYEGLIRGNKDNHNSKDSSYIKPEWAFLNGLSKLEKNVLYEPRVFKSKRTDSKEPDWDKSNYQFGFTGLDNSIAEEQTEVRVMHDDEKIYFRLKSYGDSKDDFFDILLGNKKFKVRLEDGTGACEVPYEILGLDKDQRQLKVNIIRNRIDSSTGFRTSISSWSPNQADLYIGDKKQYIDNEDVLSVGHGLLVLE